MMDANLPRKLTHVAPFNRAEYLSKFQVSIEYSPPSVEWWTGGLDYSENK